MSLVDIIIPVYGGKKHLEKLIPALRETLEPKQAKVFFVDDVTPETLGGNELREYIQSQLVDDWNLICADQNGGFSATNNLGVSKGKSEYICMLNSDTVPQAKWLNHLIATLDAYPQVGAVGAKLLFPPWSEDPQRPGGKIQHAGVAFNTSRMPYHLFLGWDADHPKVNRHLMMQAVTGACCLTRRELWETIGGLNPIYGQGNFEDIEYCLEVCKRGYDIAYNPDAVLYHWGSGSNNTEAAEKNQMVFASRWCADVVSDDWKYW
jgi:O-antigen biosynthesis protein